MLKRVLEPEVMDSKDDANDYDSMDHSEVNRRFVDDLLRSLEAIAPSRENHGDILDLGAGTAQIPILLCQSDPNARVVAIDLARSMIDRANVNVIAAGLASRVRLELVDAKRLPYADGAFEVVMSNSIVHHIPEPYGTLAEAVRVTAPGGLIFVRDLMRPDDDATVSRLVETYAGDANDHQRQLFRDSLYAALNLAEIRQLAHSLGFDSQTVQATSDRHWTWSVRRP